VLHYRNLPYIFLGFELGLAACRSYISTVLVGGCAYIAVGQNKAKPLLLEAHAHTLYQPCDMTYGLGDGFSLDQEPINTRLIKCWQCHCPIGSGEYFASETRDAQKKGFASRPRKLLCYELLDSNFEMSQDDDLTYKETASQISRLPLIHLSLWVMPEVSNPELISLCSLDRQTLVIQVRMVRVNSANINDFIV